MSLTHLNVLPYRMEEFPGLFSIKAALLLQAQFDCQPMKITRI